MINLNSWPIAGATAYRNRNKKRDRELDKQIEKQKADQKTAADKLKSA